MTENNNQGSNVVEDAAESGNDAATETGPDAVANATESGFDADTAQSGVGTATEAVADAAEGAVDQAVDNVPGGETVGSAVDAAGDVAEAVGDGQDLVSQGVGAASGVGGRSLGSAIDNAGVSGGSAIASGVGTVAGKGQSVALQTLSRRDVSSISDAVSYRRDTHYHFFRKSKNDARKRSPTFIFSRNQSLLNSITK